VEELIMSRKAPQKKPKGLIKPPPPPPPPLTRKVREDVGGDMLGVMRGLLFFGAIALLLTFVFAMNWNCEYCGEKLNINTVTEDHM
jgi:hypothetical protein